MNRRTFMAAAAAGVGCAALPAVGAAESVVSAGADVAFSGDTVAVTYYGEMGSSYTFYMSRIAYDEMCRWIKEGPPTLRGG